MLMISFDGGRLHIEKDGEKISAPVEAWMRGMRMLAETKTITGQIKEACKQETINTLKQQIGNLKQQVGHKDQAINALRLKCKERKERIRQLTFNGGIDTGRLKRFVIMLAHANDHVKVQTPEGTFCVRCESRKIIGDSKVGA